MEAPMRPRHFPLLVALVLALAAAVIAGGLMRPAVLTAGGQEGQADAAAFQFDATWPKPLPDNWTLGNVVGVAVDARDHIWIVHRPGSLTLQERGADEDPPLAECCRSAPPVIEFDQAGNVVNAWGGPGEGYEWPDSEHGIFIDHLDNVWLGGSGGDDAHILKFTRDGEFLLQIGRHGRGEGSNDLANFGQPAEIDAAPETNEVYIADGYGNRRVAVFDADTGEYKRHWGAYGNRPTDEPYTYDPDAPPSQQFGRHVPERGGHRGPHPRVRVGVRRRLLARRRPDGPLQHRRDEPEGVADRPVEP